jgi:hypothetical protein
LYFNIEQFSKDFLSSVESCEKVLKLDGRLRKNFSSVLTAMKEPLLSNASTKSWLDKSDFSILDC